jgi:uncharacterized phage protein (TIGR02218 family)
MKALPAGLQAHLDTGATTLAWCWRVERRDGQVYGFTSHDRDLTFDGTMYEAGAAFTPAELRSDTALAVDAQDAEGALSSDTITEADIAAGRWDGAVVQVWRVNWQDVSQRVLMRSGTLGEIRRGRVAFTAEVRSLAHALAQPVGRTYQGRCDAELGDARCGVNLAAFTGTGAVGTVLGARQLVVTGLDAFAPPLFNRGLLTFTSGANAGLSFEVAGHLAGELTLLEAPVLPVVAGDAIAVSAGCDKTAATCRAVFGNIVNFRGFPDIPGEDALRVAKTSAANTGAVL